MKNNKKVYFYIIMFLIPVLLIAGGELLLRALGYGIDYKTFVELKESPGQYFLNPRITEKYFSGDVEIPSVIPDPFDIEKRENTIRIFALGGSTTAGFPYPPNASFPRSLKRKLEMVYPESRFEVVNLGISAVNSHFIRDIIDDVLDESPDIILIYAGHNEYYGALGPASSLYLSGSNSFIQFILDLREFRLYQFFDTILGSAVSFFGDDEKSTPKTLMGEMVFQNEIPLNSDTYFEGEEQFKENLDHIIGKCEAEGVELILSTLVSNLKQEPLEFEKGEATKLFHKIEKNIYQDKKQLRKDYLTAKDLDKLRFRAPESFNEIIIRYANDYDINLVRTDSLFSVNSPDGITGYNLMVDHLHPNLNGLWLMTDGFFDAVDPVLKRRVKRVDFISEEQIDKYLRDNFPMTRFDSTFSEIRIKVLLNNFPFTQNGTYTISEYNPENYPDSLALRAVGGQTGWSEAHLELFGYFLFQKKYNKAYKELFTLMEARPFYKNALYTSVPKLINGGLDNEAKHILVKNHRRYPDAFTSKYLGLLNLEQGNLLLAERLLNEAISYQKNDPQTYFLLSKSQFGRKEINAAIKSLQKCLDIDPNYPQARDIFKTLKKIEDSSRN